MPSALGCISEFLKPNLIPEDERPTLCTQGSRNKTLTAKDGAVVGNFVAAWQLPQ